MASVGVQGGVLGPGKGQGGRCPARLRGNTLLSPVSHFCPCLTRTAFANPTEYTSWNGFGGCCQVGTAGSSYLRNHGVWLLGRLQQVAFCKDKSCRGDRGVPAAISIPVTDAMNASPTFIGGDAPTSSLTTRCVFIWNSAFGVYFSFLALHTSPEFNYIFRADPDLPSSNTIFLKGQANGVF